MSLDQQYATGLSRPSIEQALLAAGIDLGALQRGDLAPLEDFHAMGRNRDQQSPSSLRSSAATRCSTPSAALAAQPAAILPVQHLTEKEPT
jgi:hypothetical protein